MSEPKFKVGDYARVVSGAASPSELGSIIKIGAVFPGDEKHQTMYLAADDMMFGVSWSYRESGLEPATVDDKPLQSPYAKNIMLNKEDRKHADAYEKLKTVIKNLQGLNIAEELHDKAHVLDCKKTFPYEQAIAVGEVSDYMRKMADKIREILAIEPSLTEMSWFASICPKHQAPYYDINCVLCRVGKWVTPEDQKTKRSS